MTTRALYTGLSLALALTACGDDTGTSDTGVFPDAGPESDAGETPDAGNLADSGEPTDAGPEPRCPELGTALPEGTAPERRGDMASAFDPACGRVYMFSGDKAEPLMCNPAGSQFVDDFHVFDVDRNRWYKLSPSGEGPLVRARSQGVWDPNRGWFIVSGGRWRQGTSGAYTYLNDVWAYDAASNTWTQLAPFTATPVDGPVGRMNFGMVADPANDRIIITHGGQVAPNFQTYLVDGTTWAFDLEQRTWSEIGASSTLKPTPRLFHQTALDTSRQRLFIYSGAGENALTTPTFFPDLWFLDLSSGQWTQVPAELLWPTGRIKGELRYDAPRDRLVLYAGHDDTSLGNNSELWTFNLDALSWTLRSEGDVLNPDRDAVAFCDFPANFVIYDLETPERRESHLFVLSEDAAFMYGGRTDCGLSNDTWRLDLETHTWTMLNDSFNGLTCPRQGRDDCFESNLNHCGGPRT